MSIEMTLYTSGMTKILMYSADLSAKDIVNINEDYAIVGRFADALEHLDFEFVNIDFFGALCDFWKEDYVRRIGVRRQ